MSTRTLLDVEESAPFIKESQEMEPNTSEAQKAAHYGLMVNIFMVFIKAIGGYLFSSEALLADAFHSATDILADLVTLVTVLFSRGDSKRERIIEGLGSLCVSGFIFTGGAAIAMHGLAGMRPYLGGNMEWLDALQSDGESVLDDVPNVLAAWVALASILAKEWVYRISKLILPCYVDHCSCTNILSLSHEDCNQGELGSPEVECYPPPYRLFVKCCRTGDNHWRLSVSHLWMVGSRRCSCHIGHGCASWS